MGIEGSNNVNRTNNKKLRKILKAGHYAYVPVKGKYGNTEDSFIIFNLPLDNAKEIATETSQESFIFGRVEDDNAESAVFDLYVIDRSTGKYEYEETKNYHINGSQKVTDDETGEEKEDLYTQVGDKKFSVDFDYFKEGMERFNSIISEQAAKSNKYRDRIEKFQECLIEEGRTGRSAYMNRSLVYGSLFSKLDEKENGNNM
jgi:hypothetical protein